MKIHPHVVPNPWDLRSSSEHKLWYIWWNLRAFWPCIDSNTSDTFKAQKGSKNIVKGLLHSKMKIVSLIINPMSFQTCISFVRLWNTQKKYSHRFIKFRLNHWWLMDYFDDVFHTFLGLVNTIYLAVNVTVTSLPVFIHNILNCVPNTNKAFTGLERPGGKWLKTKIVFWGEVTL